MSEKKEDRVILLLFSLLWDGSACRFDVFSYFCIYIANIKQHFYYCSSKTKHI